MDRIKKMCFLPQRVLIGIMCLLAVVNAYTMRICLNMAITEMIFHNETVRTSQDSCPVDNLSSIDTIKDRQSLYDWDEQTQGLILGAFYWGYPLTHLPGGIISERFGAKYTLGLGLLSTALFTLVTPLAIHESRGNWIVIFVLRLVEGMGEGVTYPALNVILARWIPLKERGKMGSFVFAGSQLGTILGNLISAALIQATENWTTVFYFFGGLGVLWVVLWQLLCHSDPSKDPFISDKEREYLEAEITNVSKEKVSLPWGPIFKSPPVWALVAAQIGHDWGFYTMVTDLPKYMKDVLKFKVSSNGIWSSFPYFVMWIVSIFSGWLSDRLINKNVLSVTASRKLFTSFAAIGPAIFIVSAGYTGCSKVLAVVMFTLALGMMGTYYCGMRVNAIDLSPNFAGTLMAITNGIGALTGIATPYLVGYITDDHSLKNWRIVFWVSFGVFITTTVFYAIWGSGELQWWNNPKKEEEEEKEG